MARKRSDRQQSWDQHGLPHVGRAALTHYNKHIRPFRPRCGAKTKSTEDQRPCRNLALAGQARCRNHGGKTPKGDEWGLIQWPNGKAPDAERKLQQKLKRIERDRKAKAKRLAAMSLEGRQRHNARAKARAKSHTPGPAAERVRQRAERKAVAEIQESLARTVTRPVSPELAELQAERERLEAERDRVLNQIKAELAMQEVIANPVGVFQ